MPFSYEDKCATTLNFFRKSFLNLTAKQVWKTVQVVAEIKGAYLFPRRGVEFSCAIGSSVFSDRGNIFPAVCRETRIRDHREVTFSSDLDGSDKKSFESRNGITIFKHFQ